MPPRSARKSVRMGIRLSERQRDMLRDASRAEGTTVTDFVLRHSTWAAERVLADRRAFRLSEADWDAFTDALERPSRDRPRLRALMDEAAPETR